MMEIILAGVVSLVITLAAGKLLIPALIRLKAGQSIKEVGPTWHKGKQGTPTMGGLMFIIGIGIAILILGWKGMLEGNFTHLYVYVFALVFGVIGYIDDYQKVKHHQNTGLTAPQKFLLQHPSGAAVGGVYDLRRLRHHRHRQRREHHRRRGRPVLQRHGACGRVLRGAGRPVAGLRPAGRVRRRSGGRSAGLPVL